jgi:protein-S-isoprenylcysteine O-methyltransferase Ste14
MNINLIKTISKTVIRFLTCVFLLPLIGKLPFLLNPSVLILMALWSIGLVHQEIILHANNIEKIDNKDRTQGFIALCGYIVTVSSLINFAYFHNGFVLNVLVQKTGFVILILGFILRGWSLIILGGHFSKTAAVQSTQFGLVKNGLYAVIRHPIYLGAIIFFTGQALLLGSIIQAIFSLMLMTIAYSIRIKKEEGLLESITALDYEVYKSKTWRLIPFFY